jgi:RNA polymerase sigma-70 factor, ECF subfamily
MSAMDPEYIARCRPDLLRFAASKMGMSAAIEDVVQDALLAALRNRDSFAGRSSPKTWLFGVLDHKVKDAIRLRLRAASRAGTQGAWDEPREPHEPDEPHETDAPETAITQSPEHVLHQRQFLASCDDCLKTLSARQAQAFFLRECMEYDTLHVCREMQISQSNLNVTLFRARQRLRTCLEARGFAPRHVSAMPTSVPDQ